MEPVANGFPKGAVPAVVKATSLMDALAASKEPLGLSPLANQLALPKSTVHALCATLVHSGLVRRFEDGTYHLGMHIMDLSHAFLARSDATVEFTKLSVSLDLFPEDTVILSVLDGADVVYVACRNGTRPLNLSFGIGMRLPANCAATGKALLSTLSEEHVAELSSSGGFRRLTKKSVTDLPALLKQLGQVRKHGYSIDDEETRGGTICFGAPVFDSFSKQAVAGIGVCYLKASLTPAKRKLSIHAIRDLSSTLSSRLGARGLSIPGV